MMKAGSARNLPLSPVQRVSAFLKIHPAEQSLVSSLVSFYFVLALSFVFLQSMAFGVFVAEYGPDFLPLSYLSTAVFATLLAVFYLKLGERLPFPRLVSINLAFLASGSFFIWLGLRSPLSHAVAFILPLWFQVVLNLSNLVVWPLAGRLLDIQQGKRLFGLLGAGMWLANIIGGLFVPALVRRIGSIDLLVLAVFALLAALLLLRRLLRKFPLPQDISSPPASSAQSGSKPSGWQNRSFILAIFGYTFIWWVSFYFVDNIFYNRLAAQFPAADQLTAFMGSLLSLMGVFAFFTSLFLTSRLISRFGLRTALITMPLLVTLIIGLLALAGSLAAPALAVFGLAVSAKLINVALGFSLSQSAHAILYQSLSEKIRPRVQTTAEGIVQPIAIGSAGLFLLALTTGLGFDYIMLSYVFLALGLVWIAAVVLLSRGYLPALLQTIARRRLGDSPLELTSPTLVSLLREHLQDPQPGPVLYSMSTLERIDPALLSADLPALLSHPSAEVRRHAFTTLEHHRASGAIQPLLQQLAVETDPAAREAGLQTLAALTTGQPHPLLHQQLASGDLHSTRGALVGLLKYHFSPSVQAEFDALLHSELAPRRSIAAQVLGRLDLAALDYAFPRLIEDSELEVRLAALKSASLLPRPALAEHLVTACASPHTSRVASAALAAAGEPVLPAVEPAFTGPHSSRLLLLSLARALGEIGTPSAGALLLKQLDSPDSDLRHQVLASLSRCGYRTRDAAGLRRKIESEMSWVAWTCALLSDLAGQDPTALLSAALHQSLLQARRRVFLLLSFLLDSASVLHALETLSSGSKAQAAYALEIVESQLPAGWNRLVLSIAEELTPQQRLDRLAALFPQPPADLPQRMSLLISGTPSIRFTTWQRLCALHSAARLSASGCLPAVVAASEDPDPLVASTARWAHSRLAGLPEKGEIPMLSTVEKVLILKSVGMFSQTPDEVLADVAGLLVEVEAIPGQRIISQGEQGDSLYLVVDGKVRVHQEGRLLNELGRREVFGEMALLDPEPRMASITALEPTHLFRLDQSAFYQLISERPEVSIGILRVLTARLRQLAPLAAQQPPASPVA